MARKNAANPVKKDDGKPLSRKEEAAVDKMLAEIEDIPLPRVNKPVKTKKEREQVIDVVRKVLSEYIGPYIIIGYDLSGGPFADFNCTKSPIEHKATLALFEEVADDVLRPKMMFGPGLDDDDF
jgi:hypothetical protein